jgi:hypothetical protein
MITTTDIFTGTKQNAVSFLLTASRETLISLLSHNDTNGVYKDVDTIKQFGKITTLQELKEAFLNQWEDQTIIPFLSVSNNTVNGPVSVNRIPAYENEICKSVGLIATCNSCDRIIFEDENFMEEYSNNGGYCSDCNNDLI